MSGEQVGTHINFDILVLEIKGVLPHIDTDDGDQVQEGVLVGSSGNLQTLRGGVKSLGTKTTRYRSDSVLDWFTCKLTSQHQPEPWMPAAAALNSFLKLSREPNPLLMAWLRWPSFNSPPFPPLALDGARFFQNKEWLM